MIDIHSKVQAAQERLTSELYELFREALAGMASDVGQSKPVKAAARKPAAKKAVAKKAVAKKPAKPVAAKPEPKKPEPKPVAKKPEPKPVAKKPEPKPVAKKAPARKPAPKKAEPKKVAAPKPVPGKRVRRSLGQLKADADKVVKILAANKNGLRIEQINKLLGTTTRQLARPILKLLEDRKIRKQGDRRATVYFPA